MTPTGSVRLSYHEDPRIALKTTPSSSSSSSSSPHDEPNTTTNQDQPLTTPTPPLFTPIWDYEKFPVGPCVRERDRVSQEVQQALLSNTTSGTKYKGGEDLVRGSSFPGISSNSNSNALHRRYGSRSGGSGNFGGAGRVSRHGSRHGSCTVSSQSIPSSPTLEGFGPLGVPESTTISPTTTQPTSPTSPTSPASGGSVNFVPTSPSKFDQIKAQMERVRSIRVTTTTHSTASSSSSSGGRVDPSSKVSLMHTATSSSSSSSSSTSPISVATKDAKKKGILHRLFHPSISSKKKQKSKSRYEEETTQPTRDQSQPLTPTPEPQHPEMQERQPRTLRPKLHQLDHRSPSPFGHHHHTHQHNRTIGSLSSSSSRSSLLNEKDAHTRTTSSSHPPRVSTGRLSTDLEKASSSNNNNNAHDPTSTSPSRPPSPTFSDRSPVEHAQDRWREEWLGPSGAILTLFRDQPAKFDCPHCGAIKVVSDVQYVPGVMSYLVAFGLLFLTLGALSYLPFRKQHEGTKDCVHWCPTCGKEVARFMRATGTFEWI
ncbi:hypothetical protein BGZ74_002500 [Mortierella antarctica]|nr:hypothetical protein BGZ74_002500 [Mortierella antarctica]